MSAPATLVSTAAVLGAQRAAPVRVMHVIHQLGFGGMELGVVKLVNALDRTRVTSSICSCRPATGAKERLAADVPLIELERRGGNDPALVGRLYRVFRRERPDIVHTHAWGTLVEGLLAARLARIPVVVHGEHGTLQTKPHQCWVQRLAWASADAVLSVSTRLAERMAREVGFPLDHIRTIRNGVDLTRFRGGDRDAARRALGISREEALVVGTVGRLVPVKDQRTLVSAAGVLHRSFADLQVVLVGDGPLRGDLSQQIQALGLVDVVRLLGNRADVERVLPAFDVFVLPSLSEGMSNTIQEAMGTGLPVVATDVGGARELVVKETGLLIPAATPEALASALAWLLERPAQRAGMGAAARRRVETEFSLERMIRDYERVYHELIGLRGAKQGAEAARSSRAHSLH
jgi:sugar transferase (PEP-CTERM/EpsH1 system associated)